MPSYPGLPKPRIGAVFTHEESATRGTYAPGTTFQIASYEFSNVGTYIDSPFHRHPSSHDLARLPLEKLANLDAILVTFLQEGPVPVSLFDGLNVRSKAVLVRTDWSKRWDTGDYFRSGPFLPVEVCETLVEGGAALVGIDCANIDNMADPTRPAHTMLLAEGIPIVEHLRGLDKLSERGFRFFAVPPAIEGGTSFTVRAFAIID